MSFKRNTRIFFISQKKEHEHENEEEDIQSNDTKPYLPNTIEGILLWFMYTLFEFIIMFWILDWLLLCIFPGCPSQVALAFSSIWIVTPSSTRAHPRRLIANFAQNHFPRASLMVVRTFEYVITILYGFIYIMNGLFKILFWAAIAGFFVAVIFVVPYHLFQFDKNIGIAVLVLYLVIYILYKCICPVKLRQKDYSH